METRRMTCFELGLEKRVSYIVATKDRAAYLEKALQNIRELKRADDEVIVVDGLSQDGTPELAGRYADVVDLFLSETDLGEIHAWNKGILLSRGRYIKILSDDDVIHREGMEQAVRVMDTHPDVDVLLCGGTKQQGPEQWLVYLPPGVNYGRRVEDVFVYGACGVGLLIRRRALAQVNLLNPAAVANDADFLCRCISQGANVKFCRINMYHHPIEAHSTTIKRRRAWERDIARIKRQWNVRLPVGMEILLKVWRMTPDPIRAFLHPVVRSLRREGPAPVPVWDGGFS